MLVRFPQDETGKQRKLSRPWHGPYRIIDRRDPDVTVVKVYAPQDGQIQVQTRVALCPPELPSGFFWYGNRRARPGRPPKWVDKLLQGDLFSHTEATESEDSSPASESARVAPGDDQGPPETQTSGADSEDHIDEDPGQLSPVTDPGPRRKYGLRSKTTPPARLMLCRSRTSSLPKEGEM